MKHPRQTELVVLLAVTVFLGNPDAKAQNPGPPASVTNTTLQPRGLVPGLGQGRPELGTPPALSSVPQNAVPGEVNNPDVMQPYGVGGFYQRGTNFFYPRGTNGFFRRGNSGQQRGYYPDNGDVFRRGPGGAYRRYEPKRWDDYSNGTNNPASVGTNGSSPYHMR